MPSPVKVKLRRLAARTMTSRSSAGPVWALWKNQFMCTPSWSEICLRMRMGRRETSRSIWLR